MSNEPLLSQNAGPRSDEDIKEENSSLPFLVSYVILGALILVNYVTVGVYLNKTYPLGNIVNPKQTGAFNLWGAIYDDDNKGLLAVYYCGFVVATVGYLLNINYVFRVHRTMPRDLYYRLCGSMLVFMITEHMWMPLCAVYIGNPTSALWWVIFWQLKVSALASIFVAVCLFKIPHPNPKASDLVRNLGLVGSIMFAAHCTVLDGGIWSFYFTAGGGRFPPPT
ncbi:unnamed protein product [Amoebophrya sp. A120]|nr:unnamed protein product [Amoebophrya sp. A120]|eukprot:GSA120T00003019001.1